MARLIEFIGGFVLTAILLLCILYFGVEMETEYSSTIFDENYINSTELRNNVVGLKDDSESMSNSSYSVNPDEDLEDISNPISISIWKNIGFMVKSSFGIVSIIANGTNALFGIPEWITYAILSLITIALLLVGWRTFKAGE